MNKDDLNAPGAVRAMRTSSYFNKTIFYHATPAIDKLFEDSTDRLFERDGANSAVEFHVPQYSGEESMETKAASIITKPDVDVDRNTSTEAAFAVDHSRHPHSQPQYFED